MVQMPIIYQDGKVFKEIEFQILLRKVDIKNLEISVNKVFKLAGTYGPKGEEGLGVDYSRVNSSTPVAHIGLEDAIRLAAKDRKRIKELKIEISELRARKRSMQKILKSLDDIEAQLFYHRVIMRETQDVAADEIGISKRHLQRMEKSLKTTFKLVNCEIF